MRIRELNQEERESVKRIAYLIDTYCDGKQVEFAKRTGIMKSSVSQYMSFLHAPTLNSCIKIAETFNVNLDWLRGLDVPMRSPAPSENQLFSIPVYDNIPSGVQVAALQSKTSEELSRKYLDKDKELFAFEIADDAMSPRILKGDIVIVSPQADAESKDLVIVSLCGKDAVCRRLMKYQGSTALFADNPNVPPVYIPEEDKGRMQIIGKVIELRARF